MTSNDRVMIVEDEAVVALDLERRLGNMGYSVAATVASGEEAICKAELEKPDLVLMDISLKGKLDGLSSAEVIHRRFGAAVVFLTAYADDANIQRALLSEPHGYLVKPFNERELHATIRVALHRHRLEKRTRDREKWFALTLSSMTDGVIVSNRMGAIVYMNPAAQRLSKWALAEARGLQLSGLLRVESADDASAQARLEPDSEPVKAFLVSKDGTEAAIECVSAPLGNDRSAPAGVVTVFRQAIERRAAWPEGTGLVRNLNSLLSEKDRLNGLLVICSGCRNVREDSVTWSTMESYLIRHSKTELSHGLCPSCVKKLYPDLYDKVCGTD